MAAQNQLFAETIRAMKVAMRRRADDSDSNESIHAHTNRANKLKRKAADVREGRLDDTGGLSYKKKITHAGYTRPIISANPTLFDSDGEPYSPSSSRSQSPARAASPLEENPYSQVEIHMLLQPITKPADLSRNPTTAAAYKSTALSEMAEEALEMVRKERQTLASIKRLFVRLLGDSEWAPCGRFEVDNDDTTLLDGESADDVGLASAVPSIATGESATGIEGIPHVEIRPATRAGENGDQQDIDKINGAAIDGVVAADMIPEPTGDDKRETNGVSGTNAQHDLGSFHNQALSDVRKSIEPANSENTSVSNGPTHSMTTRRKARSPTPPSSPRLASPTASDSTSVPAINPWFLPPMQTLSDRDLALPISEAEDTRHLLSLYIQKHELLVRHLTQLSSNLLKADRMRKFVWDSCNASGHLKEDGKGNLVTEMSDGEDWFDVEAAGLQNWELSSRHYLEKGKDEVEEPGEEEARRGGRRRRVVGR